MLFTLCQFFFMFGVDWGVYPEDYAVGLGDVTSVCRPRRVLYNYQRDCKGLFLLAGGCGTVDFLTFP